MTQWIMLLTDTSLCYSRKPKVFVHRLISVFGVFIARCQNNPWPWIGDMLQICTWAYSVTFLAEYDWMCVLILDCNVSIYLAYIISKFAFSILSLSDYWASLAICVIKIKIKIIIIIIMRMRSHMCVSSSWLNESWLYGH